MIGCDKMVALLPPDEHIFAEYMIGFGLFVTFSKPSDEAKNESMFRL